MRATHVLQPGEEVSVSYLGTEDHAPASMRRKVGRGMGWCGAVSVGRGRRAKKLSFFLLKWVYGSRH